MPDALGARARPEPLWRTAMFVALAILADVLHVISILGEEATATKFMSLGLWQSLVALLGGRTTESITADGSLLREARLDVVPLAAMGLAAGLMAWLLGALLVARRRAVSIRAVLTLWGRRGWSWLFLAAAWELLSMAALLIAPGGAAELLLVGTLPFWHTVMLGGLATSLWVLLREGATQEAGRAARPGVPWPVWVGAGVYLVCMGTLNTRLYDALNLPHGDSAMYEEHLWNVTHGKGFRSFLDDGRLFLGEHIQVAHLLLLPAYLLWPSHVTLEWLQSALLAAGALPVYWLAHRHGRSRPAAVAMALAYLVYLPMQFLDISIDFKTFRPNSFEIPLLLLALDAFERARPRAFLGWCVLALACQEDAAVVLAPLGVWIALSSGRTDKSRGAAAPGPAAPFMPAARTMGWAMALFCVAYVAVVIKVVLPWFRGGADVHFARYFAGLGEDTNSIVGTVIARPGLVLARLVRAETALFMVSLVAPLGFLPLLAPGRLAIAGPLFAVLCLSDITDSPLHHFHAPIVPIVVWCACCGLGHVPGAPEWLARLRDRFPRRRASPLPATRHIPPERFAPSGKSLPSHLAPPAESEETAAALRARRVAGAWALSNGLAVSLFFSLGPLGIAFWDPYSPAWWKAKYAGNERSRRFARVYAGIPRSSRVASTDYLHTRFTHHERSYDYSGYRPRVPDDAEYLVIDAKGPGSQETRPEEVAEYRARPDRWQIVGELTDEYFIVFRRKPALGAAPRGAVN